MAPPATAKMSGEGNLPQFMLLGAQKAATTSVFRLLQDASVTVKGKNQPLVCGRAAGEAQLKESHFFDAPSDEFNNLDEKSLVGYRHQFTSDRGCARWMDATTSYLYDRDSAGRMLQVMPGSWMKSVKMIAILREPIARDLSMYNMAKADWANHNHSDMTRVGHISTQFCGGHVFRKRKGNATAEVVEFPSYAQSVACRVRDWQNRCMRAAKGDRADAALRCSYQSGKALANKEQITFNRLTIGMYAPQVSRYAAIFTRARLMVLNFDSLVFKGEQGEHIQRVAKFLSLPTSKNLGKQLPTDTSEIFPGKLAKADCKSRDTLWQLYSPFNAELVEQLAATKDEASEHEPGFAEFRKPDCGDEPLPPDEPHERVRTRRSNGQRTLTLQGRWSRP